MSWRKINKAESHGNYPTPSQFRLAILRRGLRLKKADLVSSSSSDIFSSPNPDFRCMSKRIARCKLSGIGVTFRSDCAPYVRSSGVLHTGILHTGSIIPAPARLSPTELALDRAHFSAHNNEVVHVEWSADRQAVRACLSGQMSLGNAVGTGKKSVIGGGSIVTKDIPANVIAVGFPCKVIRVL